MISLHPMHRDWLILGYTCHLTPTPAETARPIYSLSYTWRCPINSPIRSTPSSESGLRNKLGVTGNIFPCILLGGAAAWCERGRDFNQYINTITDVSATAVVGVGSALRCVVNLFVRPYVNKRQNESLPCVYLRLPILVLDNVHVTGASNGT